MIIRRAEDKDIPKVLDLLSQVLELHAAIRPDYFVPGTTKYSHEELSAMFNEEDHRIYIAADENDSVLGYAFCKILEQPKRDNMVAFRSVYIDDLCVDEKYRGQHIGRHLFEHVKDEAKKLGCYTVTLNVWEGNDSARSFYDRMGFRPLSTRMEYILH